MFCAPALLGAVMLAISAANAQTAGDITVVGMTQVSAMMMYLGNDDYVYILDKSENNAAQINGHPAYGAVWDIAKKNATVYNIVSNPFCAAGAGLPDGTFATFGGNIAVTRNASSVTGVQDYDGTGASPDYGATDGRKAVRIIKPCTGAVASWGDDCQETEPAEMTELRWYATAESLGDGSVIIVGGMTYGGYINRSDKWFTAPTQRDPVRQHGNAQNTIEFYPNRTDVGGGSGVAASNFLVNAGGLNTYAHTYLMPSGKIFMNANVSNVLIDPSVATLPETPLPDDPNNVVRVYPASAGVAMLPLTPANNYSATILFCGGTNTLSDLDWGSYHSPMGDVWERKASDDCQRLEPEPADGTAATFEADDAMPDPRTMGQFILLPDGTMLMINGARMGTAGYTTDTPDIKTLAQMPFYMSIATDEVLTPAIYDPSKPKGSRWNSTGLQASTIPRLYHSTALLLPDGSVMVAGSNPSADVTVKADNIPYPTTYEAEYFYPPYWGKTRPVPSGLPSTLSYGGASFQITLAAGAYTSPNDAASKAKVVLIRPGFTTHAMNMGQRYLQLNSTYQVDDTGKITLTVSQLPPNANLFTPGSALIYVVVDGVPSIGTHLLIGSGKIETQPTTANAALPANAQSAKFAAAGTSSDSSSGSSGSTATSSGLGMGVYIGIAAAGVAVLALLGFCLWRRHRNAAASSSSGGAEKGFGATAAAAPAMRKNPYAMDEKPLVSGPYINGAPLSGTESALHLNASPVAPYDYDRTAVASPSTPYRPSNDGYRPSMDNNGYNSQPQREYQPQGGYQQQQRGGYTRGGY